MVLFIVSAVLAVFSLGFGIYLAVQFIKNRIPPVPFNKLIKRMFIIIGVFTLSFATMMISIYLWGGIKPKAYELTAAIVGGLLVGFLGSVSLFAFLFHYWGGKEEKGISEETDKWMFKVLMAAFPLFLISIFFLTEGFANYVKYPLPNGFSFTEGTDNLLEPTGYQYYPVYEEAFDKEGNILPGIKILAGFRYE